MPTLQDSLSASVQASVQSKLQSVGSDVRAQIDAQTGIDIGNQRTEAGAASAISLLGSGYNPDSQADNERLIHVISGGLALIPGAGLILAGFVEGLWQVGKVVACPVEKAFASIGLGSVSQGCGGKPCATSGTWTVAGILTANAGYLPPMPQGSFASLVIPALANYAVHSLNCKGGVPPGMVVDACVEIWNRTHGGPAVEYFVPPLGIHGGGGSPAIIAAWPSGVDRNVQFAFQSAALGAKFAAVKNITDQTTWGGETPYGPGFAGMGSQVFAGAAAANFATAPRLVMVNTGALLPAPAPKPKVIALHGVKPSVAAPATAPVAPKRVVRLKVASSQAAVPRPRPSRAGAIVIATLVAAMATAGALLLR